jgi:hypothetical protein
MRVAPGDRPSAAINGDPADKLANETGLQLRRPRL